MLPDAIILAICGTIQAICNVVLKAMEGATPEQRQQMWSWYIADVENFRKTLHLPTGDAGGKPGA